MQFRGHQAFEYAVSLLILSSLSTSVVALALLAIEQYSGSISLVLGVLLGFAIQHWLGRIVDLDGVRPRDFYLLLVILVVSVALRADISAYALGGQDQGLYVLISSHLSNSGSLEYNDGLRSSMPDSLAKYYDEQNQRVIAKESAPFFKDGEYEGIHHLGVYISDLSDSVYSFQFYPLNSVWISVFSDLFGKDNGVFAVSFFGSMIVLLAFLLIREATGGVAAGLVAAMLFSVNAVLVFFSKFPVAEMLSLYFLMAGGYLLVRYYRVGGMALAILSALMLGAMFFTRLSGFMMLPLVFLITLIGIVTKNGDPRANGLAVFGGISLGLFGLATWFGYEWSYPYVRDIFANLISGALGPHTVDLLGAGFGFLLLIYTAAFLKPAVFAGIIEALREHSRFLFIGALLLILSLALMYIYRIGFTEEYLATPMHARWRNAGLGWESVKFSSLYVTILFLTPPALLLALIGYRNSAKTGFTQCLVILLCVYLVYAAVLNKITPYLYYYSRYIVSELLPVLLLLASLAFVTNSARRSHSE